jgi:hypothetical protein
VVFFREVTSIAKLQSCAAAVEPPVSIWLTRENYEAAQAGTPTFDVTEVTLMTNSTGHPTIGGLRVDEIFSECFQQSSTQLQDGRWVYEATAYANDNHSECVEVAQIVLDYKSSETLDFQAWQVAALPLLAFFFVVYAGLRLGTGR